MLPTPLTTLTKKMSILVIFSKSAHLCKSKKKLHHFGKISDVRSVKSYCVIFLKTSSLLTDAEECP